MKLLLLNTNDISDGAAIAAYRLLKGLQQTDVQAQMLIQSKENDDYNVIGPETKWQKFFGMLRPALDSIPVIFGSSGLKNEENLGFKNHYLGRLNDEISLALVYSASDAMIVPSIQDNLPNTVMESISCGTPVVAFDVGGIHDMIDHQKNGYLVKPFDTTDLAHGIKWVLEDNVRWRKLSENARTKAINEFDIIKIAEKYKDLYEDILKS